jgi:multiple antibiotic resistance protein
MYETLIYAITVFTAIFAIVDPIGNVPLFYSIIQKYNKEEKLKIIKTAIITALVVLFIFGLVGNSIFMLFQITIPAFRIAGGLLLFRVAFNMLYGTTPGTKTTQREKEEASEKDTIGIVPMGIPLLAGPGAISTVMLYNSNGNLENIIIVFISVIATLLITYILLRNIDKIFNKLGRIGSHAISRIMGLILAAIAVQFLINGVHQLVFEWIAELG